MAMAALAESHPLPDNAATPQKDSPFSEMRLGIQTTDAHSFQKLLIGDAVMIPQLIQALDYFILIHFGRIAIQYKNVRPNETAKIWRVFKEPVKSS